MLRKTNLDICLSEESPLWRGLQLEQTNILLQDLPGAPKLKTVLADLGFRGVDADVTPVQLIDRGKHKTLSSTK